MTAYVPSSLFFFCLLSSDGLSFWLSHLCLLAFLSLSLVRCKCTRQIFHITLSFNHLNLANAVMVLLMSLASWDTKTGTIGNT